MVERHCRTASSRRSARRGSRAPRADEPAAAKATSSYRRASTAVIAALSASQAAATAGRCEKTAVVFETKLGDGLPRRGRPPRRCSSSAIGSMNMAVGGGDVLEPRAQLLDVAGELVELGELRAVGEPEDALEEGRRLVAHGATLAVAAGLGDQAALDEARDGRVGGDAADAGDLGARHRAEVGDDRQGLERRLGEPALHRAARRGARTRRRPRAPRGRRSRRRRAPGRLRCGPRGSGRRSARARSRRAPAPPRSRRRARRPRAASRR